jgi:hypothetical protein
MSSKSDWGGVMASHGAGKKKSKRPSLGVQLIAVVALAGLAFGGAFAVSQFGGYDAAPPKTLDLAQPTIPSPSATPNASRGLGRFNAQGHVIPAPGGSGRPSNITNPVAWQYDPESDQHWHEEHWHWHDGKPPAPERRGTPGIGTATSTDGIGARGPDGSVIPTPGGSGRPSKITHPTPWQYDPESNQHWHEPHWHWHDGPPPPESERGAASALPIE